VSTAATARAQGGDLHADGLRALHAAALARGDGDVDSGLTDLSAEVLAADHVNDLLGARDRVIYPRILATLAQCEDVEDAEAQRRAARIAIDAALRAQELLDEEAESAAGALRVVNIAEFLTLTLPPRELLLDPWIARQAIALIHAWRGAGKTLFALSVAAAVATARQYLRWTAPTPRRVLYIDGEMPAPVMQERLAHIFADGPAPPDPDYLRLLTPDLQPDGMPDLSTKEGQAAVEPFLNSVELVIVDNISTLCRTGVENDAESWLVVQQWALSLRRRGLSSLFVHHDSKNFRQRGTSKREDVVDSVISLRQPADYRATEGARFEVHFEKTRGFRGKDAEPFEAQLTEVDGRFLWTMKSIEDRTTERVAELLTEGLSQREIAKALGIGLATVSRHAKKARGR